MTRRHAAAITRRPRRLCSTMLIATMGLAAAAHAQPAAPAAPADRALAATCAACHGTDGAALDGMPALRGLERAYLVAQLNAFRDGSRPATVMHQIAKGYTPEQIERLAAYFSALPKGAP